MKSINVDMQDYFVKLAPDFSVFDMAEKYFYDNDVPEGVFENVFSYHSNILANAETTTTFYRGMFLIHSASTEAIEIIGASTDEYTIFPYNCGTNSNAQILIAIQDSSIIIKSDAVIDMMIGVAF